MTLSVHPDLRTVVDAAPERGPSRKDPHLAPDWLPREQQQVP